MNNYQAPQGQYNPAQMQQMPAQMQQMPAQMQQQMPQGQYNPAPMQQQIAQGQYNSGQMQQMPQQEQKAPSTVIEVARSNYTTIALLEVSGGFDPAMKYPKSLCFVMGVPGLKDASKQSGRTYQQDAKITMKFSTQEIRSLGHALINIAVFKQAALPFEKHSDPSKNTYTQNNAQQQNTKKLKASFDQARSNIVITMNYGTKNVMIPVPLQDALGLGEDLINIGNYSDMKLFDYKMAHKIGREEVTGIDYDPAGTEDPATQVQAGYGYPAQTVQQGMPQQQAPVQQQYNPAQYQGVPQGQPQYNQVNPAQQQVPQGMYQGMPGAQ